MESPRGKRIVPFDLTQLEKDADVEIYKMQIRQSITTLEEGLKNSDGQYGNDSLPIGIVQFLKDAVRNDYITDVTRRIQYSQINHIINITKQKLVDTLLELNLTFPNLQDDFQSTPENKEKASTIINNHISGNNVSTNIGIGDNLSQKITNSSIQNFERIRSDLENLGVPRVDLDNLKEIIENESDRPTLSKKILGWVGKMASKAVEKGIEIQVPDVLGKLQELI